MPTDLPRADSTPPEHEPSKRSKKRSLPKERISLETIHSNIAARMAEKGITDDESARSFFSLHPNCALHVGELELGLRTSNALEKGSITRVLELLHCTRRELLSLAGIGDTALEEIYDALEDVGFSRQTSVQADDTAEQKAENNEPTAA